MSDNQTFVDLALNGDVLIDDVDDFVDQWHDGKSAESLADYLGMTEEEYSLWVSFPNAIGVILSARHDERSVFEAVNDNFEELKLAARAGETPEIARLKTWLRELGKIS